MLIPPGPIGDFDMKCLMPAASIVTHEDEHWLYYEGCPELHEQRIRVRVRVRVRVSVRVRYYDGCPELHEQRKDYGSYRIGRATRTPSLTLTLIGRTTGHAESALRPSDWMVCCIYRILMTVGVEL